MLACTMVSDFDASTGVMTKGSLPRDNVTVRVWSCDVQGGEHRGTVLAANRRHPTPLSARIKLRRRKNR